MKIKCIKVGKTNQSKGFYKFYKNCGCLGGVGFSIPNLFSLYIEF